MRTGFLRPLAMAWILGPFVLAGTCAATVTMVPGGGLKKTDCMAQLAVTGTPFPEGTKRPRGVTCADGDVCDQDGERNGVCEFSTSVCINTPNEALGRCKPSFNVLGTKFRGADPKTNALFEEGLALPSTTQDCSVPMALNVAVRGANKSGEFKSGKLKLRLTARARGGRKDRDKYQFVCRPAAAIPPAEQEPPPVVPVPPASPGAGLDAQILDATATADGLVTVTFKLTDAEGMRIEPTGSSTSDPKKARVRLTIARLELDPKTEEGFTTTFTRYVNYITGGTSQQPTYDSGGTFALVNAEAGTYTYAFSTRLPAGFPATLTHSVGAQIERTSEGQQLVANPIFDFVPAGGPVTTVREDTTTAQCNACHDPLALHGGGRREVRLCQLCHTDQAVDPDTGNAIDFKVMVHKIHRGKELPSVDEGPVGTKYSIIGFGQSDHVYGEKVSVCEGGEHASAPCTSNDDCPGGTCTGEGTAGVGFPQNIRNCQKCHAEGATAANYRDLPSTAACTACHDDINPGETPTNAGAPGTGHVAGAQPDAFCKLCHVPQGEEFGISVSGAHTVPARSQQLGGLQGEILSASGAKGGPVTIMFRLSDGGGTPLDSLSGLSRVAVNVSGPTSDFGSASPPVITATIPASGTSLSGPDAAGVFTYTLATNLPGGAAGTWRVGLEARRSVALEGDGTVTEAIQNPVFDFSVDGSPVVHRRQVVDIANCGRCHGVFSKDFSIHGSLRNQTEYCVICHNPNANDFNTRSAAVRDDGANPVTESINLKHLIHKIHTGEELEDKPYIIYGRNSTPNDFSEVLYPGDRRDCSTCHVDGSYLLPLPEGVLPTIESRVNTTTLKEETTGATPPTQDACLACHDGDADRIHAETQTTASGDEACLVCHGEGKIAAVSEAHATSP